MLLTPYGVLAHTIMKCYSAWSSDIDIFDIQDDSPPYLVACSIFNLPPLVLTAGKEKTSIDLSKFFFPLHAGTRMTVAKGIDPRTTVQLIEGGPIPVFPDGMPFAGQAVVETLGCLRKVVGELIDSFFQQFGKRE